ncbi:MAG: glycine-rich protein [Bacteroidota bacterium]
MKNIIIIIVFFLQIVAIGLAQTVWTGAVDTDWHKACNWSTNAVPTCSNNVIIPSVTNKPTVSATACFLNLEVQTGANLTVLSPTLLQQGCPCTPTITAGGGGSGTLTFNYTGAAQAWTVPACVTSITIDVKGSQGGDNGGVSFGGRGGRVQGTIAVTTGEVLYIYVGGAGAGCATGGYNGGGNTTCMYGNLQNRGGGASDIRRTPYALGNRLVVAGGGGGTGYNYNSTCDNGGNGGGLTGISYPVCAETAATGGTQSSGGAGGVWTGYAAGSAGVFGTGGDAGSGTGGGGGGGGYYGGGGGGWGGGAGGSSLVPAGGSTTSGVQAGNGQVTITW